MLICQLTNSTPVQMMGYVIRTECGRLIVIDGGNYGQSKQLEEAIKRWGNKVDMWFLTHNHSDHYGSIIELLKNNSDIEICGLWRCNCSEDVIECLPEDEKKEVNDWLKFEKECHIPLHKLAFGERFCVDNVNIEVLGTDNPEIKVNNLNNQSVVLKFLDDQFSIIFLGDLGVEGGKKLLQTAEGKLKCTAVQMAHHGQSGVSFDVYDAISPKYAFWPTPKWLWDNTQYLGGTPGMGHFKTPETINHMNKLNATHITSFLENTIFDTKNDKSLL